MATKKTAAASKKSFPYGLVEADFAPSKKLTDRLGWDEYRALGLESPTFTLYEVEGRRVSDWIICTLQIGKARGAQATDRYYGIDQNGNVVRVGKGPHVKQVLTIWLSKKNVKRLQPVIDQYLKGMSQAGQIRDRISSRRAEGQLRRANGESFWYWNK